MVPGLPNKLCSWRCMLSFACNDVANHHGILMIQTQPVFFTTLLANHIDNSQSVTCIVYIKVSHVSMTTMEQAQVVLLWLPIHTTVYTYIYLYTVYPLPCRWWTQKSQGSCDHRKGVVCCTTWQMLPLWRCTCTRCQYLYLQSQLLALHTAMQSSWQSTCALNGMHLLIEQIAQARLFCKVCRLLHSRNGQRMLQITHSIMCRWRYMQSWPHSRRLFTLFTCSKCFLQKWHVC